MLGAGITVVVIRPKQLKNCDKQLRDAICDFADGSHRGNPWAGDLYGRARARGHDHPHAVRIQHAQRESISLRAAP